MMPENPSKGDPTRSARAEFDAEKPYPNGDRPEQASENNGPIVSTRNPGVRRGVPAAESTDPGWIIETVFNPFHCLYQDALFFHTQSRVARSDGEASRLARSSLLLYLSSAEALVHQAAEELGRPELHGLIADPSRPMPLSEAWRLLPSIVSEPGVPTGAFNAESPPWPQFAELLMLRASWAYPGPASSRRAYYRSARRDGEYEPLQSHQVPAGLRRTTPEDCLAFPRTGLPRDPYALRPRHLDTARGILDAAIEALDRRMGGALTKGQRHRREPVRVVHPSSESGGV